jgi:hypothetical protein
MYFSTKKTRKLNDAQHHKVLTTLYITQVQCPLVGLWTFLQLFKNENSASEEDLTSVFRQEAPIRFDTVTENSLI